MERRNMEDIKDHKKGGNNYRKKEQGETVRTHLLDGGGGACSGTKEGLDFCLKEKIDIDAMNSKLKKRPRGNSVTATHVYVSLFVQTIYLSRFVNVFTFTVIYFTFILSFTCFI